MGALIFRYEWLHFRRNRWQVGLLTVLFGFGLYAIYYGNRQIDQQRTALALAEKQVQTEWTGYRAAISRVAIGGDTTASEAKQAYEVATDPAFAWWQHPYLARLDPSALASLAVGQRDLNPGIYRLTGMNLYYRLFQTDLANPQKLLVGNFDLSFVLIYLLPLFVIALSFSLLSGEQEAGVLPLLQVQAPSVRRVLVYKMLFAFGLVTGLALLLSVLGFIASGVSYSRDAGGLLYWLLTVVAYCAFWYGLVWLIVSFNQSSAANALVAVGGWLLFLLVIPSLLSAYLSVTRPVDSSGLAVLARREGIANENDPRQVRAVIRRYLQNQPRLVAPGDTLYEPNVAAKGYAAFSQLNDAEHRPLVEAYWQGMADRDAAANRFGLINPAVNAQELLNRCARTDLATNLAFLRQLSTFHGQITQFYFTRLFKNQPITLADYADRPTNQPPGPASDDHIEWGLFQLLVSAGLLFGLGWINLAKQLQ
ncbi:DUF3526 domain-containing protein [Spirosoma arcticum]